MTHKCKKECLLLFMPCMDLGGAEKQFRLLRNELIKREINIITVLTSSEYTSNEDRIYGIKDSNSLILKEIEILKIVLKLQKRWLIKCAIVYDKYAQFAIPTLKLLGIKTLFSERNSGKHKSWISRKIISFANIITTNSENAKNTMADYINKEIYYIPNGIELDNDEREIRNIEFSLPIKILVPARIAPVKNQLLAIKALENNKDIVVHFAGKIDDVNYYKKVNEYIHENRLESRFIYDGFISDMKSYYKKFDIILLPSLSEGTSNVILEAFASRMICIASDIEMNKAIVPRRELLFISNNIQSLKDRILYIYNLQYKELIDIIDDCYEFVSNMYSVTNMVNRFLELIT